MAPAPIIAIWAVFKIMDKGWQWILVTAIAVAASTGAKADHHDSC